MSILKEKQIVKRVGISLAGFVVMAFGVAFSIKGNLGTSPISSVPYTISQISGLTVGTATMLLHCIFVLIQILLLRKKYEWFQLTQILVGVVFGSLTDLANLCLSGITVNSYPMQWVFCIIGIILVGLGVSLEVSGNILIVAGEGLVVAICKVVPVKFGNMKVIVDVCLVIIAVALGLCFRGEIYGVREGTLAAAILVGQVSKLFLSLKKDRPGSN